MSKPRVLVTRQIPEAGLKVVKACAEVEMWDGKGPIPRHVLSQKIPFVEGLYCLLTDVVDEELLGRASRLRVVSTMAVGYDHIDVHACTRRKIPVGNTPGVLTETVARRRASNWRSFRICEGWALDIVGSVVVNWS